MRAFIQDFCDSQGDNYKVGLHHDDSEITVRGGAIDAEDWKEMAGFLASRLLRDYGREYEIYSYNETGFILTEKRN